MKTKIILAIIIMLSTLSCKKGDKIIDDLKCTVTAVHGKKDNIIGKWKLVKQDNAWGVPIVDYSCQNIIYEFKSDGGLLVTGNVEYLLNIPLGAHKFELTPSSNYPMKDIQ